MCPGEGSDGVGISWEVERRRGVSIEGGCLGDFGQKGNMYRSHVRTVSAFGDSAKFAIVGTIPSLDFDVLVLNFAGLLSQVIKGL